MVFQGCMLTSSALFHLWKQQVFLRNRNEELTSLLGCSWLHTGIYMIGCADLVVYVGHSNQLSQRSIDSLGRVYHRVPDTTASWSIAFAPCPYEDMDEYESAAIRAYAPQFNTSIPSIAKSTGRMPIIAGTAQVFTGQDTPSTAFSPSCLERQLTEAMKNPTPPWRKGNAIPGDEIGKRPEQKFDLRDLNTNGRDVFDPLSSQRRRVQHRKAPPQKPERIKTYVEHKGVEIHIDEVTKNEAGERCLTFEWMAKSSGKVVGIGVEPDKATAATNAIAAADEHLAQPYRFKNNLDEDGSVITRDGEYIGTWEMDENDHPSFTPLGETEVLFFEMWVGLLCQKIADWHDAQNETPTT